MGENYSLLLNRFRENAALFGGEAINRESFGDKAAAERYGIRSLTWTEAANLLERAIEAESLERGG